MIAHNNPYELFTPIHLAWLYRRHQSGLNVTTADLDSIEDQQPLAAYDPLSAEYRALQAAGKLHKRRGRKPLSLPGRLRLWAAFFAIEEQKAEIWQQRRSGIRPRQEFDESPVHEAAEAVARTFRLGSGRSLLNQLSREGVPRNY